MRQYKFILSGGGTGGHIYTNCYANELKLRLDAEFLCVELRTRWKCKNRAGYKIKGLWIAGLQRKN
jgi:UDP-N-acetylglucosamine--N-acetylmuramyl-(pentapeptide) pyrophosphoryl-undecaprenol N-acetylglucosamine transferase